MTFYYSDPSREKEPHALPDVEYAEENELGENEAGWYWWGCFPGCLPNGDAIGPFETEEEALADAREGAEP